MIGIINEAVVESMKHHLPDHGPVGFMPYRLDNKSVEIGSFRESR
jgi:hypothetical protein